MKPQALPSSSWRSSDRARTDIGEDTDLTPEEFQLVLQLRQQYLLSSVGALLFSLIMLFQLSFMP